MPSASSSKVWGAGPHAGAAEPGEVTFELDDASVLRVAFYNVGIQQPELDKKFKKEADKKPRKLARDIAEAFNRHHLDLLCLCELGEHGLGLHGRRHLSCGTQAELLEWVVELANEDLGGASEPAELVSGEHPTYAVIKRTGSRLEVEDVLLHRGLDGRATTRPDQDRMMLTLPCKWMGKPIMITIVHCPSSKKRPWDQNARDAVLPNLFRLAGLVPFEQWGGGAAKPAAWILGGDLNMGEAVISNEVKRYQPPSGTRGTVQMLDSGSFVKRGGDIALAQHVRAYQRVALIGKCYNGVSDAHNMVVILAKTVVMTAGPNGMKRVRGKRRRVRQVGLRSPLVSTRPAPKLREREAQAKPRGLRETALPRGRNQKRCRIKPAVLQSLLVGGPPAPLTT